MSIAASALAGAAIAQAFAPVPPLPPTPRARRIEARRDRLTAPEPR